MGKPKTLDRVLELAETDKPETSGPNTERQAAFVRYYAKSGCNGAEAARLAGYSDGKAASYYLLAQPHIRKAIRAQRESVIHGDLAKLALTTLSELMLSDQTPAAVKHSAARTSLEMAGHLGGKNADSLQSVDKPLGEMTIGELEQFIASGQEKLSEVLSKAKVVPAEIIG